jgi:hypothetical protein
MCRYATRLVSLLLGIALLPSVALPAGLIPTGENWTKWDGETRMAYVQAYIHGTARGFRDGCVVGQRLYTVGRPKGLPGEKCVVKYPQYSKYLEDYVSTITDYYHSYPADQDVPIFNVLESLSDSKALSIQQMHEQLPGSVRKRQ